MAQLKETLKKERDEIQNLKRKYEDMMGEVKTSITKCQTLQADKNALEISTENKVKNAQVNLAKLQKLHLEHQMLKTEKDDLQLSYGNLSVGKNKLESRVAELEMEKATIEEKEKQTTEQVDAQGVKDQIDTEKGQSDPDPLENFVSSWSILGKA